VAAQRRLAERACEALQQALVQIPTIKMNQKNPHKATHGQGEADPSATSRVTNPASRSDIGLGGL